MTGGGRERGRATSRPSSKPITSTDILQKKSERDSQRQPHLEHQMEEQERQENSSGMFVGREPCLSPKVVNEQRTRKKCVGLEIIRIIEEEKET